MTTSHESVLPCRLVQPREFEEMPMELALVAFVSTIPLIPDSDYPDHPGYLWKSPVEVLQSRSGTAADHAVSYAAFR
jgi:hypothetical protein